jgi:hypothetical protein
MMLVERLQEKLVCLRLVRFNKLEEIRENLFDI